MRFRFRLQRVLDMRQKSEEAAAMRLADARREEEQARDAVAQMQSARDQGMQAAAPATGTASIGQLQNLRFLVERLNHEVDQAEREVDEAGRQVGQRLEEFSNAFRDRKVLDRLRERALETWKGEEVQADRQAMDNIALARFVRSRGKTPGKGD